MLQVTHEAIAVLKEARSLSAASAEAGLRLHSRRGAADHRTTLTSDSKYRLHVMAESVDANSPDPDPEARPYRIASEERPPSHREEPRPDTIQLAKHLEEACHDDQSAAVAAEEALDALEAVSGYSEARDQAAAAEPTDGVADVIANHSCCPGPQTRRP